MALSPMMQHWSSVKDKYKDCIIFYRLGDFYEMFFDDAIKASQLLDLTLTGRDCGLQERAPMCGIPHHACNTYIAKLVSLGEKVAICEQLTEPTKNAMVERDVIRVVTAGTLTDETLLDDKKNNYIASVFADGNHYAVAWTDITTGEFFTTSFSKSQGCEIVIDKLIKIGANEIICNSDFLLESKDNPAIVRSILPNFSCYVPWAFNEKQAQTTIKNQLNTLSLSHLGLDDKVECICASGALIEYLKETQKHSLKNIDNIKLETTNDSMTLDSSAIKNLELTKTIFEGKRYGSLLWLLDKTKTSMGARLLNKMVISPLGKKEDIEYRLDGVEEIFKSSVVMLGLGDILEGMHDIERLSGKISNGNITPRDCISLANSLELLPSIKFQLAGFNSRIIADISNNLHDFERLTKKIKSMIVAENTPVNIKEGGFIAEGFSSELDELRSIKENSKQMLAKIEAQEREKTGIKTLRIGFNRVFGYYIEVSKSFKDSVPYYYQRRQTLANGERYIIEELKELEEKILNSEERSLRLELSLFEQLKIELDNQIGELKEVSSAIALLDCIRAFSAVSKENKYVKPTICSSAEQLEIYEGRHPVVEKISKERFVPNDCILDNEENRTLIITGPNMAGKSTFLRQTAIICLMAQIGCFVPAKSAKIPVIDKIFTRIGASDNLILDQSTFMVEMNEVATIIQNATENSLLILDEVGRGTSTFDGLSIAWAVLENLTQKIKAKTLFATHYHELTELEGKIEGVKNFKVAVKELNGSVVFLRKIMRGGANKSFGIEVASLAGIPKEITDRAKVILKKLENQKLSNISTQFDVAEEVAEREKSEVELILNDINIDNLTPMQAMMILSDLIEKVRE